MRNDYEQRKSGESKTFEDCEEVHDLPPIYNYWSNKYLLPKLQRLGGNGIHDVFVYAIRKVRERRARPILVASLGAGNCDFEVEVLARTRAMGIDGVELHCHDLHEAMLERGEYNHQLLRQENEYEDWDCSNEGFEGIRAQDILPLLLEHFEFEVFGAFANIIDAFIGRSFGPNFLVQDPFDLSFIGFVAKLDERLLRENVLKPTHMFAWMTTGEPEERRYMDGQDPRSCVRPVEP